jgi:protein-tyrosine-phosphatase
MAERIARKMAKNRGMKDIKFSSAGVFAKGENISDGAKAALKTLGYDYRNRKSVPLKKIKPSCVYVAVTSEHKRFINSKKVLSFEDLAGGVVDPYGQTEQFYLASARQIEQNVAVLLKKIENLRGEL